MDIFSYYYNHHHHNNPCASSSSSDSVCHIFHQSISNRDCYRSSVTPSSLLLQSSVPSITISSSYCCQRRRHSHSHCRKRGNSSSHSKSIILNAFIIIIIMSATIKSTEALKIMVTGSNGYLGSWIVKELLQRGHTIHACVRDKQNIEKHKHLLELPNANDSTLKFFSIGNVGKNNNNDNNNSNGSSSTTTFVSAFDEPMKGCDAIIHVLTPLVVKFAADSDGERDIYKPAIESTKELLNCISSSTNNHLQTIKSFILTSSMSSVAPVPEPPIKDESHWSDSKLQKERGSWYGAAKTDQELVVQEWVKEQINLGSIQKDHFQYVAICPTMIIGPQLNNNFKIDSTSGTVGRFLLWLQNGRECPNDSMSFVHVQDCALMHVIPLEQHLLQQQKLKLQQQQEQENDNNEKDSSTSSSSSSIANGRYMCLIESLHWNDIVTKMKKFYPDMPKSKLYTGPDPLIKPTQFNFSKMNSLGINVRSTDETFKDIVSYLKQRGAL